MVGFISVAGVQQNTMFFKANSGKLGTSGFSGSVRNLTNKPSICNQDHKEVIIPTQDTPHIVATALTIFQLDVFGKQEPISRGWSL